MKTQTTYEQQKEIWNNFRAEFIELAKTELNEFKLEIDDFVDHLIHFRCQSDERAGFYVNNNICNKKIMVKSCFKDGAVRYSESDTYFDNGVKVPLSECGFGFERSAIDIIKGIKKRFLPQFEVNKSVILLKMDRIKERAQKKNELIEEIKGLIEGEEMRYEDTLRPLEASEVRNYIQSVQVNSESSINIELRYLNKEQAIKLIEAIKSIN